MYVKEDLFYEEELATVLKGLKKNKGPGADSVVNEFLEWWLEVRNKQLKIVNMIFEKGKVQTERCCRQNFKGRTVRFWEM